jgi:CHAD domain-containing protein
VGERVRALATSKLLACLVELHSRRQTIDVHAEGAHLATLTLDEIAVPLPGSEPPAHLARVELAAEDDSEPAAEFARSLESACNLRPTEKSRFDMALFTVGLSPPAADDPASTSIDHSSSVGQVARAVLRTQLDRVRSHEPGTRLGEEIEQLHDMRVATRRIRAALRLFSDHLPRRMASLRTQFSWLGCALGEVRDLDVHLEQLDSFGSELSEEDRPALDTVAERLREQRTVARRRMLRALDSRRYERLLARADREFREPRTARGAGTAPILAQAPDLIRTRLTRVIKAGRRLRADSPAAEFHRLRIRCKALRYALEFHREVYGNALRSTIRPLVELQDLLGDHQDADVAALWLRKLVRERRGLPSHTVFVAGILAERYGARARKLRARFRKTFTPLRGKRRRRLSAHLERMRPAPVDSAPRSSC